MQKKLFTIGPVQMYPSTTIVRAKGFPHFRTDEFSNIMFDNSKKLKSLLGAGQNSSIIYFASSGTGLMEATVENCFSSSDKVLVINGGGFGKRFCELLQFHKIPFDSIDLEWNEALTQKHFLPFENKNYTALLVNLHETSTGQLYPIDMISDFCKRNNMYLIVDAISTFLADDYDMEKSNIDLTIISSQKGLCLSPGMSMVAMSKRMIDKIMKDSNPKSFYFDFKDYLINITRGQTPYTPPVCIILELQDMLSLIEKNGGKIARLNEVAEKCNYFRKKAKNLGFSIPNMPLSNMLTPLQLNDVNAYDVIQVLKNDYGYYVNPCGGKLENILLRVSHIGNTTISDIDDLFEKIILSIEKVRNKK